MQQSSSVYICTLTGKWTRLGKASGTKLTISKFSHFLNDQLGTSWAECTHTLQAWVIPSPLIISSGIVEGRGGRGAGRRKRKRRGWRWRGMSRILWPTELQTTPRWTNHSTTYVHTDNGQMCKTKTYTPFFKNYTTCTHPHPSTMIHVYTPAQVAVLGVWIK